MTNPKDPADIEDVDWDEALAEWEEKSFSPEVARDVVTDKPAAMSGPAVPRPLYRPPTPTTDPRPPSAALAAVEAAADADDDDGGATLIAAIPQELLRRGDDRGRPGASRGGLGQLFARDTPAEPGTDKAAASRETADPPDVVTSAKSVTSHLEGPAVEPRRRSPDVGGEESVREGELFDPFAEDERPRPADRVPASKPPPAGPVAGVDVAQPGALRPEGLRGERGGLPTHSRTGAASPNRGTPPASTPPDARNARSARPFVPKAETPLVPRTEVPRVNRGVPFAAPKIEGPRLDRSSASAAPKPHGIRFDRAVPPVAAKAEHSHLDRAVPSHAPKPDPANLERRIPSIAPTADPLRLDRRLPSIAPKAEPPGLERKIPSKVPSIAPTADPLRLDRSLPSIAPQADPANLDRTVSGDRASDPVSDDDDTAVRHQPGVAAVSARGRDQEGTSVPWDEAETSIRIAPTAPLSPPPKIVSHPPPDRPPLPAVWPEERPADDWLDDRTRAAFEERAAWLEEEARALGDTAARARSLLVCSELLAIVGRRERAQALAAEAADSAETLALAHRQARMLMPWPPDPDDHLESLKLEVKTSAPGPAQLHSLLLEAEALRARGDDDGAATRLEQAARGAGFDLRAAILRATGALAEGTIPSSALRLPDSAELAGLAQAIATCLRLRGVEPASANAKDSEDVAGSEESPNVTVLQARRALGRGDVAGAAPIVARLTRIPELAQGTRWLAAVLGATSSKTRALSVQLLKDLTDGADDGAFEALVALSIELGDPDLAISTSDSRRRLSFADRLAISTLMGSPLPVGGPNPDTDAAVAPMRPLLCAAYAVMPVSTPDRADQTAGAAPSSLEIGLGRRLASRATDAELGSAIEKLEEKRTSVRAVALELSARAGRIEEVTRALQGWKPSASTAEQPAMAALAAALVAERSGAALRAAEAFGAAHAADPACEVALRALASLGTIDHVAQLNALADELADGLRSALARIEAVLRGSGSLPDPTQGHLLELAHRSAPNLPVAGFLAERIARRAGDVDEVLRWIRERRDRSGDSVEVALESVREALLVADSDPDLAGQRLREAHLVRPRDAALRELYERMAADRPDDVARWREQRAAESTGDARFIFSLEATYELERQGDDGGALRCATAATAASDVSLGRVARERSELRTGQVARLTDELLAMARGAPVGETRREAYERLAVLDSIGRNDAASALLWHRSVLELVPEYLPSLRHVEHHLVGEGREDELETVAASIAKALRGGGPGECTAHAELAARLRLRESSSDTTRIREMVDLAVGETNPSLWSLRMLYGLARTQNDAAGALAAAKLLVERVSRPLEMAFLLVRAAEAALSLDLRDEARSLLERATVHDPGDVLGWSLLADVRKRSGDVRGAAEAAESLARCSESPSRQISALYEASRLWMDEVKDEERAMGALEAAASVDLTHEDVFDRLSRLYAGRRMQSELADLLQRRIDSVSDPDERLAIEVRRGRVLLEVGEVAGARRAFEAALDERPDDPGALSAFADLCVEDRDWPAAEQALVRLARLLPTPEEQRAVYARLGELYSRHLVNLSRAEVAFKEVLKRAPDDVETMVKLVDVHKRQNDPARATELQQEVIARATSPVEKRERILELAAIHERIAHDPRRAERTLDAARRDSPQDVALLRALAEFYLRYQQTSAVNILLDRAAADARRVLASGRIAPEPFQLIATTFELRGQPKAAAATLSILSAVEGKPSQLQGVGERAFDPALDDTLAPDLLSPAIRTLLAKTGDLLDAASPLDLRDLRATPIPPGSAVSRLALRMAAAVGLPGLQMFSSPKLGAACLPGGPSPAMVMGESVVNDERVGGFLALRALKLIRAKASALARATPTEVAVLASAWLKQFHPKWEPQGIPAAALNAVSGRLQAALARHSELEPDIGILALEASATIDGRQASLAAALVGWANRVALLALGDPTAALDAIAGSAGLTAGTTTPPQERSTWLARSAEARDLVTFGVGDVFAQVRARLAPKS